MKKQLGQAKLKSKIALLALNTEVRRQRLQWPQILDTELTELQRDLKYKSLTIYLNAVIEEKEKIRYYNERFQDDHYKSRFEELSEETKKGFKKLLDREIKDPLAR